MCQTAKPLPFGNTLALICVMAFMASHDYSGPKQNRKDRKAMHYISESEPLKAVDHRWTSGTVLAA